MCIDLCRWKYSISIPVQYNVPVYYVIAAGDVKLLREKNRQVKIFNFQTLE